MSATVDKSTRPDTSGMYAFTWYTETGLPVECFLDYNQPDPDDLLRIAPASDPRMELRYAFVCGIHDFAPKFTYHIIQEIEMKASSEYLKKDREERNKKFGPFFGPSIDYRRHFSSACFLG